jgi:hypothetical protein
MKTKTMRLAFSLIIGFVLLGGSAVWAEDKTAYGAITVKEGYPLAKDIDTIKSNLQLNRASELFLWALPINASYAIRDGVFEASGGSFLDVVYMSDFADADKVLPTFNNESYYAMVQIDLSKGPVVYEQPIADAKGYLFGSMMDVWQVSLTDLGYQRQRLMVAKAANI